MSKSLNRATILGNLGRDPDFRSTPTGRSVCTLSVATSESYNDKSEGWKERTEWHRVVLWDKLADSALKILQKGSKVYIEGKIQSRSYEREGIARRITEIVASSLIVLSGKSNQEAKTEPKGKTDEFQDTDYDDETSDVPF